MARQSKKSALAESGQPPVNQEFVQSFIDEYFPICETEDSARDKMSEILAVDNENTSTIIHLGEVIAQHYSK